MLNSRLCPCLKSELKKKHQNLKTERTIVCLIPIIVENPTHRQPLFQLLSERSTAEKISYKFITARCVLVDTIDVLKGNGTEVGTGRSSVTF